MTVDFYTASFHTFRPDGRFRNDERLPLFVMKTNTQYLHYNAVLRVLDVTKSGSVTVVFDPDTPESRVRFCFKVDQVKKNGWSVELAKQIEYLKTKIKEAGSYPCATQFIRLEAAESLFELFYRLQCDCNIKDGSIHHLIVDNLKPV
ncbi:hypothetical protein [Vibrio owensii]|uniref:hypothetical protein n=1 Tax=Vibrio owensii TaxID=696485 RepID=UPI000587992A|nr:hypothetical protein [Vibrio owensii]